MKEQVEQPIEAIATIGHNSEGVPASDAAPRLISVPVEQIDIWPALQAQIDDLQPFEEGEEIEILRSSGQRMPVIVRRTSDDRFEAIGCAHLVRIIQEHNRQHPDAPLDVTIRVMRVTDEDAFRLAAQELEPGTTVSSYARGCFFAQAIGYLGTEQDTARKCRVAKSTISKNLDVHRAAIVLGDKVTVRRDVSQRDAMWLMGIIGRKPKGGDAPDQDRRRAVLTALAAVEAGPARKIFADLRRAIKVDEPIKGLTVLTHDGREIGSMRSRRKGRSIAFTIADAGDVELDTVIEVIREALARTRR